MRWRGNNLSLRLVPLTLISAVCVTYTGGNHYTSHNTEYTGGNNYTSHNTEHTGGNDYTSDNTE